MTEEGTTGVDKMDSNTKTDGAMWGRISTLENQSIAHETSLENIYAGLEEIRNVLVRMQDNARPNLGGMFLVLLATCTFIVTIGGLSLAPVYRDLSRLYESHARVATIQAETSGNRFTSDDAVYLEQVLRGEIQNRHMRVIGRVHELEDKVSDYRDRIAALEGRTDVYMEMKE